MFFHRFVNFFDLEWITSFFNFYPIQFHIELTDVAVIFFSICKTTTLKFLAKTTTKTKSLYQRYKLNSQRNNVPFLLLNIVNF